MSDWKETKSKQPKEPTNDVDVRVEDKQDNEVLDQVYRLQEQEKQELAEDIRKDEEEHKFLQSPTLQRAVQGHLDSKDVPEDITNANDDGNGSDDPNDGKKRMVPLSDETKIELERIKNLPVEQRQKAMGDFYNEQNNLLGSQTDEGKNIRLDGEIKRDGKGITITDTDGIEHDINYEE
jgi:hypothetical protein